MNIEYYRFWYLGFLAGLTASIVQVFQSLAEVIADQQFVYWDLGWLVALVVLLVWSGKIRDTKDEWLKLALVREFQYAASWANLLLIALLVSLLWVKYPVLWAYGIVGFILVFWFKVDLNRKHQRLMESILTNSN